MNTLRKKIQAR